MDLPRTILVATDFSERAEHAQRYALKLASVLESRVIIAHAYRVPFLSLRTGAAVTADDILREIEHEARVKLEEVVMAATSVSPAVEGRLVRGDARDAILDLAQTEGADLIVLGTRGRGGAARLVLGSVAEHIVRHAACATLVVPTPRG